MAHDKTGKSHIRHCGPAHQKSAGINMMGSQISKHMHASRFFADMPIVSDQNPDKKGS